MFQFPSLGLIPKKEPNSFRRIHHIPYPEIFSLNDETDKALSPVNYSSLEEAVASCIAKANIKSAFRLMPINTAGFNSLGIQFNGMPYFDKCLPMGFASAITFEYQGYLLFVFVK